MNELQEKAMIELKNKNENYIIKLTQLHKQVKENYEEFDGFEREFWELMNDMEKASSQIPFLPFSNAYYIKSTKFSIPSRQCFNDSVYGTMNEGYEYLSEKYMKNLRDDISKKANKMRKRLSDNVEVIDELMDRIVASNSITKRLSGLENKLLELEKKKELFWYPKEFSHEEYRQKGEVVVPPCVESPQITNPFHRRLLMEYEYLFKSKNLHLSILKNTKAILLYINEYLPFAELVPLKENNSINISNILSPKQVQLGSENKFEGEINIGNEGEIGNGD